MPRTRLAPDYWELVLRTELQKFRQQDIADAIGISQQAVSRKMKTLSFTLPELVAIVRQTGMPIEVLEKVVREIA